MSSQNRWLPLVLAAPLLVLCTCNDFAISRPADEEGQPALPGLQVLRIQPQGAELVVGEGPAEQRFTAIGEFIDGRSEDVTDRLQWSLSAPRLGYLRDGSTLVATGIGGEAEVRARTGTLQKAASVRVRLQRSVVLPGAEGATEGRFSSPMAPRGEAPRVVYPLAEALLPPNLEAPEIHLLRGAGQGLFELRLRSAFADVRVYGRCQVLGAGCALPLERRLWQSVARSAAGGRERRDPLTLTLRALDEKSGAVGEAAALPLYVADEDVRGGVYYWTSLRQGGGGSGVYRIDLGRGGAAEAFYTQDSAPQNHKGEKGCVGCHALSRGGDRMTLVLGGAHVSDLIQLDVAMRRPTLQRIDGDGRRAGWQRQFSNFQSYGPGSDRFVAALHGALRLVSAADGADLAAPLPTGGPATHPDWSRSGALLAFTRFTDAVPQPLSSEGDNFELYVRRGGVGLLSFDGAAFSGARLLVPPQAGRSSYYPSVSPDDGYVAFNRVECPERDEDCVAYDNPRARIYLIPAGGGAEVALGRTNRRGPTDGSDLLTSSWPRFSPFAQKTADGKTLLWLTFSSKRDYGLRVSGQGRPQLWMAAVAVPPEPGQDPSFSPFWVPSQDTTTNNHIAQWTEEVVPVVE